MPGAGKLRLIKTTLGFELVRVQIPEMARKTLLMLQIAYNLIRSLMQKAAASKKKPVWHFSFKGVVDQVNSSAPSFLEVAAFPLRKARLRGKFLRNCTTKLLEICLLRTRILLPQSRTPMETLPPILIIRMVFSARDK